MSTAAPALKSLRAKEAWNFISLWTKKIHTYIGLLNFTILIVFGIAGLTATLERGEASLGNAETFTRPFTPPANADDFQAAAAAYRFLNFPMSDPLPRQVVRRDAAGNVTFDAYAMNGRRVVTMLEKEGLLKVERQRRDFPTFLNEMHTVTVQNNSKQLVIRMWSWYTEFAIWSLLFMSATGVYLWLASRPGHRWAQVSLVLGAGIFSVLFIFSR